MFTRVGLGRRMMMSEEDQHEIDQMSELGTSETVDLMQKWNEISQLLGFPTCEDDLTEDSRMMMHVVVARESPIRNLGESECRPYHIPEPSTVSHAQREPSEWAKRFVWGNNSTPKPKESTTARVYKERAKIYPVPAVGCGYECNLDDIREAFAESKGIDGNEVVFNFDNEDNNFFYF